MALKSKYVMKSAIQVSPPPQGIPTYNKGGDKLRKA